MAIEEAAPYDVVLNDLLEPTYVPRISQADLEATGETVETRKFLHRWIERGGIGEGNSDDDRDDDDIGDRFRADCRYLKNANRDIIRMLDNARLIYADDPDRPPLVTGRKMVMLDRARRIKFGYRNPRPMTLAQGLDGGVNICIYQRRRVRAGEDDPASLNKIAFPPGRIAPRHRADTATVCEGVLPDEFTVRRSHRAGVVAVTKRKTATAASNRKDRLQRTLAQYLLRQPYDAAAQAALRHT